MRHAVQNGILLTLVLSMAGCKAACPSAPAAQTPVLEAVFKPGVSQTNLGVNSAGEFEALPSSGVIIWFRAPYPTGLEVAVNGTVVEEANNVARRQALEAQGLGFWYHDTGSPDVNVSGLPRWKIVVGPPPSLRVSLRFLVDLTNTSNSSSAPRSAPLAVRVAIGIPDWVALANNADNDDAVILLDGQRTTGCANDEIWRGRTIVDVGDVRARGSCNDEVAIFSTGDAFQLLAPAPLWTDSLRDLVSADLTPDLLRAPVTVWLLGPNLQMRAQSDINRANAIYNNSRSGIAFNANFQNADNANARNLLGTDDTAMCGAVWTTALTGSAFFTAGQLNVYYLNAAMPSARGLNCTQTRNIIVIGTTADNESLAHEIGHAFSLGHSNGVTGIPASNVMVGGGSGRTEFTEGQCFRMNVNAGSALNTNGVRTGATRICLDATADFFCPALNLDIPN